MEDTEGGEAFAKYSSFIIDSEIGGYQLDLGGFTEGTAGKVFFFFTFRYMSQVKAEYTVTLCIDFCEICKNVAPEKLNSCQINKNEALVQVQ